TAHGLSTGAFVVINSVGGNTAANGYWQITKVDNNNFTLNGSFGNGTYTSGGTWVSYALVNFGAGTKEVLLTVPSANLITLAATYPVTRGSTQSPQMSSPGSTATSATGQNLFYAIQTLFSTNPYTIDETGLVVEGVHRYGRVKTGSGGVTLTGTNSGWTNGTG